MQPQSRKPTRLPWATHSAGEERGAIAAWVPRRCCASGLVPARSRYSAPFDRTGAAKANEEDVRPAFLDAVSRETFADTNINSVSRRTNPNPNLTREPFPRP